jgi:hypothetical protein
MGTLLHDGWHVLTHVDSRLWRTLGALIGRPGYLTREYFLDHRERYLPPVRLYLILSLLFFAIVSIDDVDQPLPATAAGPAVEVGSDSDCKEVNGTGVVARWLRTTCERVSADNGASFTTAMRNNVPRMMFLFLPALAAVMKLLYWRPRRMYIEHLVFYLHNHAAMFIAILAMLLVDWLEGLLPAAAEVLGLLQFALSLYMLWYLYRAMRVTYGQGRKRTIAKLLVITVAYGVCFVLMLGLTALVSLLIL